MKKKKLVVIVCSIFLTILLCGCQKEYEFSELTIEKDGSLFYIKGSVKNNKKDCDNLAIDINLKSGDITEEDLLVISDVKKGEITNIYETIFPDLSNAENAKITVTDVNCWD